MTKKKLDCTHCAYFIGRDANHFYCGYSDKEYSAYFLSDLDPCKHFERRKNPAEEDE